MSNDSISLSLVIPVYNGDELLPDCLRSVGGAVAHVPIADRDNLEIILCDNHSTDRTMEIAERFDPGCPYRIVQPPEHLPNRTENWNYGLRQGHGEWLTMLHHDDLLASGAFRTLLDAIRSSAARTSVIISGRARSFSTLDEVGASRPFYPIRSILSGKSLRQDVHPFHNPFRPFTTFRSSQFERINGMNKDYQLAQDWLFFFECLEEGDAFTVPEEIAWWRDHAFTELYAQTLGQEILSVALVLCSQLGLSDSETKEILRHHLENAMRWNPKLDCEALSKWLSDTNLTAACVDASGSLANANRRARMRQQSLELYKLRVTGTAKFVLRQRFCESLNGAEQ